jgi:septation ring formation regulator EzrA
MSGDASMERFKRKFERLHTALKESHERESEYLKKCKELHDTIVNDTAGVETAIRFTQEDDNRMRALQKELESIRKKLRAMKDIEEKNQEKIQSLKNAMKNMDESLKNS